MLPHWPPSQYYDVSGVFPMNSLVQQSFSKAQNNRYANRTNSRYVRLDWSLLSIFFTRLIYLFPSCSWFSNRNKGRQNDFRSSISENSVNSNPIGSRSNTKTSSGGGNLNNSNSSSTGSGSGSSGKSHSDVSRNGTPGGSSSTLSAESSHFTNNKNSVDSNPSTNNTATSHQRVAVTSNSQDCSSQFVPTKDTALPQR